MKLKGIELEGIYKIIYYKTSFVVCDEKDNVIYFEESDGSWSKREYNEKGQRIYFEDSYGYWFKTGYDEKGNENYYESSTGYWARWKYNKKGNVICYENKNSEIIGERVKDGERVKELTIEEIEELLGYKIKIKGDYHGG